MANCKHCGTPDKTIQAIRRLRREIERITHRNEELQQAKKEEVSKRRAIEKELNKGVKDTLKQQERHEKVKAELSQVLFEVAALQRAGARLRKERDEAVRQYNKEKAKKSAAVDTIKRIKKALRSPA